MHGIKYIREVLQEYHATIPGVVRSFLYPPRKIETAMMPCVMTRTMDGEWAHETTESLMQRRRFNVEVVTQPLPQNLFDVQQRTIDDLIQRFGEFYCRYRTIAPDAWIVYDRTLDSGWQVLDFGTLYVGFIFELTIEIRNFYGG